MSNLERGGLDVLEIFVYNHCFRIQLTDFKNQKVHREVNMYSPGCLKETLQYSVNFIHNPESLNVGNGIEFKRFGEYLYRLFNQVDIRVSKKKIPSFIFSNIFEKETPLVVLFSQDILESGPLVSMDDFPIELLYNGKDFLNLKRPVCRDIMGNVAYLENECETNGDGNCLFGSFAIMCDLNGNLKFSYEEGYRLYQYLKSIKKEKYKIVKVDFISYPLRKMDWVQILEEYDWIHFAEHGYYDGCKGGGICLGNDVRYHVDDFPSTLRNPPKGIFFNSCFVGKWDFRVDETNSFVYRLKYLGVSNVIVSKFPVLDEDFFSFTHDFYTGLLNGENVAVSLWKAKKNNAVQDKIQWTYFVYYGQPGLK